MKKDLATIGLLDYSLGMETPTTTPTTAPNLKAAYTAAPLETETKTTQGKVITCYYAKEQITLDYGYGQIKTYEIGDRINGEYGKNGLIQADGYGMLECDIIPWDKIITRDYITVRETKVTTWEILDK
jgi:hypothetical protein